jgi:hypothetical protein
MFIVHRSFWGMGRLSAAAIINSGEELKVFLNPYSDDDHIRNTIYAYIETYPHTKISFV